MTEETKAVSLEGPKKVRTKAKTGFERKTFRDAAKPITLSELGVDPRLRILIVGASGSGKTWLAGTSASEGSMLAPVLYISTDSSDDTLLTLARRGKVAPQNIIIVKAQKPSDVYGAIKMAKKSDTFKTVVIDTLSSLHDMIMEDVIGMDEERLDQPYQSDWGHARNRMRHYVLFPLKNSHLNYVLTAQARITQDDLTGMSNIAPDVAGRLRRDVPENVSIVCYATTKIMKGKPGRQRVYVFNSSKTKERALIKDRWDLFGEEPEDTSLAGIAAIIRAAADEVVQMLGVPELNLQEEVISEETVVVESVDLNTNSE